MRRLLEKRPLPEFLNVPWGAKEAVIVYILPWVVLPILLLLTLNALTPLVPIFGVYLDALQGSSIEASFSFVLITALFEIGLVYLYLRKFKTGWKSVGLRKFSVLKAIGLLLLMLIIFTVGVGILTALVTYLLPAFNPDQAQTNEFTEKTMTNPSLTLLALVIIPPILEEVIYRGFIFPALSKKYGIIFGAVVSSILFGLAHLQANVSIYTFVLGLVLCFMYVKLRSIVPGIALHMLNNYLAFIAIGAR